MEFIYIIGMHFMTSKKAIVNIKPGRDARIQWIVSHSTGAIMSVHLSKNHLGSY